MTIINNYFGSYVSVSIKVSKLQSKKSQKLQKKQPEIDFSKGEEGCVKLKKTVIAYDFVEGITKIFIFTSKCNFAHVIEYNS